MPLLGKFQETLSYVSLISSINLNGFGVCRRLLVESTKDELSCSEQGEEKRRHMFWLVRTIHE